MDITRLEAASRKQKLTPRERQVLEMVVAGERNKVIAARLDIRVKTVVYHRANMMRKLRATTLADFIRISRCETGT